jgi:uroporphyrinogen decarboxylase
MEYAENVVCNQAGKELMKAKISHRERVRTALNHEEPDRCPFQVSFTPEFANRLRKELGLEGRDHNPHGGGNTYSLERATDQDMLLTSVGWANSYYQQAGPYVDEWQVGFEPVEYETPYGKGHYTEIRGHPLAEDSAIKDYEPPDPNRAELYLDTEWLIKEFKSEYWIVGVTVTTIWETAWALRGMERMLMDLITRPDLAEQILDIPYRYHLCAAKKLTEIGVDMVWIGDDVGTQKGMLISPQSWRQFLKPRMAEFVSELKNINPDLKISYHCDGDILAIIPELIEIGIDVLNPVQPACMDPALVKQHFGSKLCFWGTIDEQFTLPFGSTDDVRTEVLERLATIGKGGGLILSPTHHVQLDTPMDNFWAMVNAATKTLY